MKHIKTEFTVTWTETHFIGDDMENRAIIRNGEEKMHELVEGIILDGYVPEVRKTAFYVADGYEKPALADIGAFLISMCGTKSLPVVESEDVPLVTTRLKSNLNVPSNMQIEIDKLSKDSILSHDYGSDGFRLVVTEEIDVETDYGNTGDVYALLSPVDESGNNYVVIEESDSPRKLAEKYWDRVGECGHIVANTSYIQREKIAFSFGRYVSLDNLNAIKAKGFPFYFDFKELIFFDKRTGDMEKISY